MHEYTAGIIDGEGCLRLQGGAARDYPRVTVSNTSLELIEFLQNTYGGWVSKRTDRKPGHKQVYQWGLSSSKEIASFLTVIYPHLIVKRKQAELLLAYISKYDATKAAA